MMLASEAGVLRRLRAGTYTLGQLYELCEQRAPVGGDGGYDQYRTTSVTGGGSAGSAAHPVSDSTAEAVEFEHIAPYPDGYKCCAAAAGNFGDRMIDGLRIYVPVRQVAE